MANELSIQKLSANFDGPKTFDYCTCTIPNNDENTICANCGKIKDLPPATVQPIQPVQPRKISFFRTQTTLGKSKSVYTSICPKCGKDAETDGVPIDNCKIHVDCLYCGVCKNRITEYAYSFKDDILCKRCYYVEAQLICFVCNIPILNEYITVGENKTHINCSKCHVISN